MHMFQMFRQFMMFLIAKSNVSLVHFLLSVLFGNNRSMPELLERSNLGVCIRERPAAPTLFQSVAHKLGLGSSTVLVGVFLRKIDLCVTAAVYVVKGDDVILYDDVDGIRTMTFREFAQLLSAYNKGGARNVVCACVTQASVLAALYVKE